MLSTPQPTFQAMVIPLWPDSAPGSEDWPQQETESRMPQGGFTVIRNVSRPTLTAYLARPRDRHRRGGNRLSGGRVPFSLDRHGGY